MAFQFDISGKPDYSFLTVQIPQNETLKVEASAMASMDANIQMKTRLKGGFSRLLTGESIFVNEFTAVDSAGELCIAPGTVGDMEHLSLQNQTVYLQSSSFVAAAQSVNLESKWQGLVKGFFGGESLFLIRCSGEGDLWFNTFGGMIAVDVLDQFVVDTGFIVAFTDGLSYDVRSVGGLKSLFFSGEGLVCHFRGKGRIWIQTRKVPAFASWIHPFRRVRKKHDN